MTVATVQAELRTALERRDRLRVNACVKELLDQNAPLGGTWQALAEVMIQNGESTLARRAIDMFERASGFAPAARFAKATVLARTARLAEAVKLVETLASDVPTAAARSFFLGSAYLNLGDLDRAVTELERAQHATRFPGQILLSLASAKSWSTEDTLFRSLPGLQSAMAGAPPLERAYFHFAAGKVLADAGDHDAAFDQWEAGAILTRAQRPFNIAEDTRATDNAMAGYSADIIRNCEGEAGSARRLMLITGAPRSGTTLLQQIVTAHSEVGEGDELPVFPLLVDRIGGASAEQVLNEMARSDGMPSLRDDYRHLLAEAFPGNRPVVDKSPDAGRYLGLAALLDPDVKMVWIKRDRLDTALSCYRNFFLRGAGWSYDQVDIAGHFRNEDRLLAFWQDALGDRLLVTELETLVAHPEPQIAQVLSHFGLSDEAAPYRPHENAGAVGTASVAQVRKPINRAGIGSAAPYKHRLQPFTDAYYG